MKQRLKYLGILLFLNLVLALQVKSQVYPVQLNAQLIPPYSLRLSDYVAPGTNRVGLNMLLTDLNESGYRVRLELTIEGNGITIKTSPNFNHTPVILDGGVPQYFTSSDLAEWFDPQNLDFSGYSKSSYLATGRLPEGVYRFSFAAYDYNKNIRVSSNVPITAWLMLNEPPLINIPFPDYKVEHIDPQNIVFQWTPRHTASPNSAFSAEYEFTLVEIWPEGRDPNNAIQTSIPVYQTTTTNTTLVYGLAEPFLEPGKQYAYRVQARDVDGRDMFKNNGYSEVRMFTFGEECKPITNISSEVIRYNEAKITWTPGFTNTSFTVRYRKANTPNAEWFEENKFVSNATLKDLQAQTTYEYQVMAYCGTYDSDYSDIQTFTTPEPKLSSFECGKSADSISIGNTTPLPVLRKRDFIWSGDFMVQVTEASGGNGVFTGKGLALIPYLGFIKLAVEFENIKVNTEKQVYEGEIKTVYNPNSPFIFTVDLDGPDYDTSGDSTFIADNDGLNDTTLVADVDSIFVDGDNIIIVNEDGTTDTISTIDNIIITDSNGDTWVVENGDVIVGDGIGSGGDGNNPDGTGTTGETNKNRVIVTFEKFGDQKYGFDTYKKELPQGMFTPPYNIGESEYHASWKSNSSGSFDHVMANIEITDTTYKTKDVKFKTASGIALTSETVEENKQKVFLYGQVDKTVDEIIAFITTKDSTKVEMEVGKLRTISYQKETYHMILVPVNMNKEDIDITSYVKKINEIYSQSAIDWNITLDNKFEITKAEWDIDGNELIDDSESGIFANYTNEMNKIIRKYKKERDPDDNFYYVFICKDIKPQSAKLEGYMPFNQQYGMIFTEIAGTDMNVLSRTVSHEIGHGAFRLFHTFSNKNTYIQSAYTTDNLMDYNGGIHLHKYQWDFIHDPQAMNTWMLDDEEAALSLPCIGIFDDCDDVLKKLEAVKTAYKDDKIITGKIPKSLIDKILEANLIKLGETDFKKVYVIYYGEENKDYTIKPTKYDDFYYTVHDDNDPSLEILDRGFEFKDINNGNKVLRIFIEETSDKIIPQFEAFKKYLFSIEPESGETISIEQFLEVTEIATKIATEYTTNNDNKTACNICVRSALYLLKKEPALFPTGGSGFNDPENNYISREVKGYITPEGQAIKIKEDLDDLVKPELIERFIEIEKNEQESWADYLKRLQDEADMGEIIVGAYKDKNGDGAHTVMITPGGLIDIDTDTEKWGENFTRIGREINKVPRILECGGSEREIMAPICLRMDYTGVTERMTWYKYIK
ncbi:MAG: fibronectin type III domain-containing protein [Bacteroidales bacterium]